MKFVMIFGLVAIVGISNVSTGTIDLKSIKQIVSNSENADELSKAFDELGASQMNQAEAERFKRSFSFLKGLFGKGGEETTKQPSSYTTKPSTLYGLPSNQDHTTKPPTSYGLPSDQDHTQDDPSTFENLGSLFGNEGEDDDQKSFNFGSLFGKGGEETTKLPSYSSPKPDDQNDDADEGKTFETVLSVVRVIFMKIASLVLIAKQAGLIGGEEEVMEETYGN